MNSLFRALRTDGKGWVYGSYHYCTGSREMRHLEWDDKGNRIVTKPVTFNSHFILEHRTPDSVGWDVRNTFVPHDVIAETVGQWAGLKDKNDKDIYKGDIVQCGYGVGQVADILGAWCVIWIDDKKAESEFLGLDKRGRRGREDSELFEVIGNIHEHPHLLT